MYAQAEKTKENKSWAVAQRKRGVKQRLNFVDNRPEAQRKLQEMANSYSVSNSIQKIDNNNMEVNEVKAIVKNPPTSLIQLKPAAAGYSGMDNMFAYKVVVGDIDPSGVVSISVDSDYNILFAIPFNHYVCQIHIHYSPEDMQYKANKIISPGDTARAHVYDNSREFQHKCNEQAIPLIIRCIPQEKMQEAKQQRDIKKYDRLTYRSLTGLSHAMRGDY